MWHTFIRKYRTEIIVGVVVFIFFLLKDLLTGLFR